MPDVWRGGPAGRRDHFIPAVVADEVRRAGGYEESRGWVLADLAAGWPLRYDFEAAREARAAGFEHVNLDLINGTPGGATPTGRPRWTPCSPPRSTT